MSLSLWSLLNDHYGVVIVALSDVLSDVELRPHRSNSGSVVRCGKRTF